MITPPPNPHAAQARADIMAHNALVRSERSMSADCVSAIFAACNTTSARRGWAVIDGRRMWSDGVAHRLDDGTVVCWYDDEPYDDDKRDNTKGQ